MKGGRKGNNISIYRLQKEFSEDVREECHN